MIRFQCPSCGIAVSAPDDCAGRATKCRNCNQPIIVPQAAPSWAIQQPQVKPTPSRPRTVPAKAKKSPPATVRVVRATPEPTSVPASSNWATKTIVVFVIVILAGVTGFAAYVYLETHLKSRQVASVAQSETPMRQADTRQAQEVPGLQREPTKEVPSQPPLSNAIEPRSTGKTSDPVADESKRELPSLEEEKKAPPAQTKKNSPPVRVADREPTRTSDTSKAKPMIEQRSESPPVKQRQIVEKKETTPSKNERVAQGDDMPKKGKPASLTLDSTLDETDSMKEVDVKSRRKTTDEELRKQLLLVPEIGLNQEGAASLYEMLKPQDMDALGRARAVGSQTVNAPIDFGPKFFISLASRKGVPEIAYLPWRRGTDCQLGKELSENLNDLSVHLRTYLREATPAGSVRPNVDLLRNLMFANGRIKSSEWHKPAAVPALVQLLQVENTAIRLFLVELLTPIEGKEATAALVQRALFDLSAEVRQRAIRALATRPWSDYEKDLLAGLRYPWPAAADHAADALVTLKEIALQDKSLVPSLIELLAEPNPRLPVQVDGKDNKKVLAVRELVRINHMSNCMVCHAPSTSKNDMVRGRVPIPNEDPPPLYYAAQSEGLFVRADTTYLRQDFSVVQPVRDAGKWPGDQRFDYLTRVRPLTKKERLEYEKLQKKETLKPESYEQKEALLFVIREMTSKDLGRTYEDWKSLLRKDMDKSETPLDKEMEKKGASSAKEIGKTRTAPEKKP